MMGQNGVLASEKVLAGWCHATVVECTCSKEWWSYMDDMRQDFTPNASVRELPSQARC